MQRAAIVLLLLFPLAGCASLAGAPGSGAAAALSPSPAPEATGDEADAAFDSADLFARMRAGFALPEVDDEAVRREIDRYLAQPALLTRVLGRGRRYLHHIVEALDERGLPQELALLPAVESAFDPFALSGRRASGLWQFMPSTGRRYGLEQDWWVDSRRDVREATRAALDHLTALHADLGGDWLLALAAYNAGAPRVKRAMRRNEHRGEPVDFFALPLPAETRHYVPRLLALARLVADPESFGIELPGIANEPYFAGVDVEHQIDLDHVADLAEIPRAELRALNPEYRRWATAPDGPHELLVPAGDRDRFEQVLAELPASQRLRLVHHRVEGGDTLIGIARRHGIPLTALRSVNRIRGSRIVVGQDLLVPLPYARASSSSPRDGA